MIYVDYIYNERIIFSDLVETIIKTDEFQRMKHISQTGVSFLLKNEKLHTRFYHSIGVYFLTKYITNKFNISERHKDLINIAGLCHDIGHSMFSHVFDNIILKNIKKLREHEDRSCDLLKFINNKYSLNINDEEMYLIENIINGHILPNYPPYYFEIVANYKNGFDVDKIDYLLRDSYFTQIEFNFDYKTVFDNIKIIDNHIIYSSTDLNSIYSIFEHRSFMRKHIYRSSCILSLEYMLGDLFETINFCNYIEKENVLLHPNKWIDFNDNFIFDNIQIFDNNKSKELLSRIFNKNIYNITNIKPNKNKNYHTHISHYMKDINVINKMYFYNENVKVIKLRKQLSPYFNETVYILKDDYESI